MRTESLRNFFATSPAVRLIRSPHAYWIIDFLNQQFKQVGRITLLHSELQLALEDFLRGQRSQLADPFVHREEQTDLCEKAEGYLGMWSSRSVGWLKRFIDEGTSEPSYQLTADLERVLAFVEQASRDVSFVGTESRLRNIMDTLENVEAGVATDPRQRLQHLEQKRAELDEQIRRLAASPSVARLTPTQIRERFTLAVEQLSHLKSEFRAVEDRFRQIARAVQRKILAADEPRGDILQYALDSEDLLKQGDQGQSFFEFVKLIHAPDSQDRIARLIAELSEIEALSDERDDLEAVRDMVPTLIAEAEKVLRTTQHLSLTLTRLLDSRGTRHHQQVAQILRDILSSATMCAELPPVEIGLEVETELEIQSAWDRALWSASEPFTEVELQPHAADTARQAAAMEQMVALERIDWKLLRQNIMSLTERFGRVGLEQVLTEYPPQSGAVELLGYLQIAFDDGHLIEREQPITLPPESTGTLARAIRLPTVIFLPESQRESLPKPDIGVGAGV